MGDLEANLKAAALARRAEALAWEALVRLPKSGTAAAASAAPSEAGQGTAAVAKAQSKARPKQEAKKDSKDFKPKKETRSGGTTGRSVAAESIRAGESTGRSEAALAEEKGDDDDDYTYEYEEQEVGEEQGDRSRAPPRARTSRSQIPPEDGVFNNEGWARKYGVWDGRFECRKVRWSTDREPRPGERVPRIVSRSRPRLRTPVRGAPSGRSGRDQKERDRQSKDRAKDKDKDKYKGKEKSKKEPKKESRRSRSRSPREKRRERSRPPQGCAEPKGIRLESVHREEAPPVCEPEVEAALVKFLTAGEDDLFHHFCKALAPTDFHERTDRAQKRWFDGFKKNQFGWRWNAAGPFKDHLVECGNHAFYGKWTFGKQKSYYYSWKEGVLGDPRSWQLKQWWHTGKSAAASSWEKPVLAEPVEPPSDGPDERPKKGFTKEECESRRQIRGLSPDSADL